MATHPSLSTDQPRLREAPALLPHLDQASGQYDSTPSRKLLHQQRHRERRRANQTDRRQTPQRSIRPHHQRAPHKTNEVCSYHPGFEGAPMQRRQARHQPQWRLTTRARLSRQAHSKTRHTPRTAPRTSQVWPLTAYWCATLSRYLWRPDAKS